MFFTKVVLLAFLTIFAVSALVPLLGIGVLVPSLTEVIFERLEELASSVESKLCGEGRTSPPPVGFDFKAWSSYKRGLIFIVFHIQRVFFLSVWFFLKFIEFCFVIVPDAVGTWLSKFATLRSILTVRPLDPDSADRVDAPTVTGEGRPEPEEESKGDEE